MNLTDIIALAKQGYKPSDIKELLELSAPSAAATPTEPEQDPPVPSDPVPAKPEDEPEGVTDPETDPEPDYKKMYEDLKHEIQQKNVRTNSQSSEPEKSLEDKMADLIRSIY